MIGASWSPPPEPLQLGLDDEEAGGTAHWYAHVPRGCELPTAGDWVWGPEACDEDGEPVGDRHARYVVVRRGWSFVSPGSRHASEGHWWPHVRVHVRRDLSETLDGGQEKV